MAENGKNPETLSESSLPLNHVLSNPAGSPEGRDRAEDYVVLFSGGYTPEANHPYYYHDIKKMYDIIVNVCGVEAEKVYILYADGNDAAVDNNSGENSDMSFAANSTVLAATEENLRSVFETISASADGNDHFLFYSVDHGSEAVDGSDRLCGSPARLLRTRG